MVLLTFENVFLLGITDTTFQCTDLTYSLYDGCQAPVIFLDMLDDFIPL